MTKKDYPKLNAEKTAEIFAALPAAVTSRREDTHRVAWSSR